MLRIGRCENRAGFPPRGEWFFPKHDLKVSSGILEKMSANNFLRLNQKVAVVTGAAGIIGKVLVRSLVEQGALVASIDLDREILQQHFDEIGADAKGAAYDCDLSDPDAIVDTVASIDKRFGRIDILFNNAASKGSDLARFFATPEAYSLQTWREVMAVNLDALFLMARQCAEVMKRGDGGSIVQTASIYGAIAPDNRIYQGSSYMGHEIYTPPVYAASKGGVIALSRYLATIWAEYRIRVNSISPGGIASGQNDTFQTNYSSRVPLGRMAETREIVDAALFLASPAASYITGQNLMVDGGLSAW